VVCAKDGRGAVIFSAAEFKVGRTQAMKAIIFDCDGTLVDSEVLSNEVLVEAVAEHGLVLSVDEAISAFRGGKMADCVAHLESRLGRRLPDHFVPTLRARTAEAFRTRLRPVAGALELIRWLAARSWEICVASSGPVEKIELSLSLTGLSPFFERRIFSSYEIGAWKPDPGLFLHAAKVMGVAPEDCAVVEDSFPGIRAGLAAGMTVFAFEPHGVGPNVPGEVTVLKDLLSLRMLLADGAAEPAVAGGPGPSLRSEPGR
jgi:HAD superfamily hydrolase (TIGR01509 family)